jgi:hypothetical protein
MHLIKYELTCSTLEGADMGTVVLSNLIFDMVGLVAMVLGLALAYCLPNRHRTRPWVVPDDAQSARAA